MKVSIALASYNGGAYILDQLKSFTTQSKLPDEVIVSDDCSTDNTVELIKKFAINAPFEIKIYVNESNIGYSRNFNNALSKTTGDLIFLSDQDDVWFNTKIEKIYMLAAADKSLLIMNDAEITDSNLKRTGVTKLKQIISLGNNTDKFVMGCCAAIKRELLDLALPIDINFPAHDTWISWLADYMKLKKITPEVLQYYRRHDSNESKYLANSTNQNSKMNQLIDKINQSNKNNGSELNDAEIAHNIFNENLKKLKKIHKPHRLYKKLEEACYISSQNLYKVRYRLKIRNLSLSTRVLKATLFYFKGGYKDFSGIFSLIRDIKSN